MRDGYLTRELCYLDVPEITRPHETVALFRASLCDYVHFTAFSSFSVLRELVEHYAHDTERCRDTSARFAG